MPQSYAAMAIRGRWRHGRSLTNTEECYNDSELHRRACIPGTAKSCLTDPKTCHNKDVTLSGFILPKALL
jgi:hypothetical protein